LQNHHFLSSPPSIPSTILLRKILCAFYSVHSLSNFPINRGLLNTIKIRFYTPFLILISANTHPSFGYHLPFSSASSFKASRRRRRRLHHHHQPYFYITIFIINLSSRFGLLGVKDSRFCGFKIFNIFIWCITF
jgi:hypothetical protein